MLESSLWTVDHTYDVSCLFSIPIACPIAFFSIGAMPSATARTVMANKVNEAKRKENRIVSSVR